MSSTLTTSKPRRSARLEFSILHLPFDNTPAPPKKRRNYSSTATSYLARSIVVPVETITTSHTEEGSKELKRRNQNDDGTLHNQIANGFTLTTFSNKSLDSFLTRESEEAVGRILKKNIEDYKNRGENNITVKELLAKNFTNYKVRPSFTSERAAQLVYKTLSENEVPLGSFVSGQPVIPSNIKIPNSNHSWKVTSQRLSVDATVTNSAEPNCFWPMDCSKAGKESKTPRPTQTIFAALESLATASEIKTSFGTAKDYHGNDIMEMKPRSSIEINTELDNFIGRVMEHPGKPPSNLKPLAYPGNHLPWHVFWKKVPQYTEENIKCVVEKCSYIPISAIIKEGIFTVPINKPVNFLYNEKPIELTLEELLTANGINMYECSHYRMLQGWLQKAGVYIREDYYHRLCDLQQEASLTSNEVQEHPSIQLTTVKLPLICIYPHMYMKILGKKIQGAVIVDTSGDKEPLTGQTYLTTIFSEPLPFESRQQILILHDAEIPIESISSHIGCTDRSVKETIGSRLLIDRHIVAEYLKENTSTNHPHRSEVSNEMMRPKSKIRRTHYVDLNKLVWKYFKDCQASGQQINGKQLKDQAMRYAREMGLESFRGSEGWLDAFKRRHRIDLKAMTGYPVCYENEMYDEVDKECRELDMESHLSHLHNNQSSSFLPHSTVNNAPDEFAASFFSSFAGFPQQPMPNPQPQLEQSTHLQNMINSMMTSSSSMDFPRTAPSTSSDATTTTTRPAESPEAVQYVMRSCQIKIADKEISHAFDTLRKYILDNDQGAMILLVQLQERLAATVGNMENCQNGSSTSSSST